MEKLHELVDLKRGSSCSKDDNLENKNRFYNQIYFLHLFLKSAVII